MSNRPTKYENFSKKEIYTDDFLSSPNTFSNLHSSSPRLTDKTFDKLPFESHAYDGYYRSTSRNDFLNIRSFSSNLNPYCESSTSFDRSALFNANVLDSAQEHSLVDRQYQEEHQEGNNFSNINNNPSKFEIGNHYFSSSPVFKFVPLPSNPSSQGDPDNTGVTNPGPYYINPASDHNFPNFAVDPLLEAFQNIREDYPCAPHAHYQQPSSSQLCLLDPTEHSCQNRKAPSSSTFSGPSNKGHSAIITKGTTTIPTESILAIQPPNSLALNSLLAPIGTPVDQVLPRPLRNVFSFKHFNEIQSGCLEAFFSDQSMVVSAPTGSGKTVVFELGICRLLQEKFSKKSFPKAVYLAPLKTLCNEKAEEWRKKFALFDLKIVELTGDTYQSDTESVRFIDVLCTTPEKWDSITRIHARTTGQIDHSISDDIALLMIDEIHQVGDSRGAALEAVVARMVLSRKKKLHWTKNLRIIAASATVPNLQDVAAWLGVPENLVKSFANVSRPVPLMTHVLGYKETVPYMFEGFLNKKLLDVILKYNNNKPAMIFCPSRKSTQTTCNALLEATRNNNVFYNALDGKEKAILRETSSNLLDKSLKDFILHGIAFHNAQLKRGDRLLIEDLFRKSIIRVLCTTTTLAQGVNLPAHLVVLKSTRLYISGKLREYDSNLVVQMIGRAGRPQFDTHGTAVIMTTYEKVHHYEALSRGNYGVIDSQLKLSLIEHMNAEICRGTIKDIGDAVTWLKCTFFWIRLRKDPRFYGFENLSQVELEKRIKAMCVSSLNTLANSDIVSYDDEGFGIVTPNEKAFIISKYYLSFETVRVYLDPNSRIETVYEALHVVSQSSEFSSVILRRNEKNPLNVLNKTVKYPLKGRVKKPHEKINLLLQYMLGDRAHWGLDDASLKSEASHLVPVATRLSKCLQELLLCTPENLLFKTLYSVMQLCQSLEKKVWVNGKDTLRQLPGIGVALNNSLKNAGIESFDDLENVHPRKIEIVLGKNPPFGNEFFNNICDVPKLALSVTKTKLQKLWNISVECRADRRFSLNNSSSQKRSWSWYHVLAGYREGSVAFFKRFKMALNSKSSFKFMIEDDNFSNTEDRRICTTFESESFAGASCVSEIVIESEAKKDAKNWKQNLGELAPSHASLRECGHHCKDKKICQHKCCKGDNLVGTVGKSSTVGRIHADQESLQLLLTKARELPSSNRVKRIKTKDIRNLNDQTKADGIDSGSCFEKIADIKYASKQESVATLNLTEVAVPTSSGPKAAEISTSINLEHQKYDDVFSHLLL